MVTKYKFSVVLLILILMVTGTAVSSPAVWVYGHVTRAPRLQGKFHEIEVNKVTYRISAEARISKRTLRRAGAYDERPATVHAILTGQKISMKVRKKLVIQIILF